MKVQNIQIFLSMQILHFIMYWYKWYCWFLNLIVYAAQYFFILIKVSKQYDDMNSTY